MDPASILAVAALVKASQPIAVPVVTKATALLGRLLGPGATALGDRLGEFLRPPAPTQPTVLDAIAMWRHGNMTLLLARTAEVLVERGVKPRPIPIAVLLPLLEAASLVDDADLCEMWAQLLASGVEADEHKHPMWVRILSQMSGEDAREFRAITDAADRHGYEFTGVHGDAWPQRADPRGAALCRLSSLGLIHTYFIQATDCRPDGLWLTTTDRGDVKLPPTVDSLPTALGAQFRRAVMPRPGTSASAPTSP